MIRSPEQDPIIWLGIVAIVATVIMALCGCVVDARIVDPVPVRLATDAQGKTVPLEVVNPRVATKWDASGPVEWQPVPLLTTATGAMRIVGSVNASGAFAAWADMLPAHIADVPREVAAPAPRESLGGEVLGWAIAIGTGIAGLGWGAVRARVAAKLSRALGDAVAFGEEAAAVDPHKVPEIKAHHAARQERNGTRAEIVKKLKGNA